MAAANKPETIQNVLTPAFLVDIDKAKRNAQKMVNICERLGVQLRPHMKTHKTVWVLFIKFYVGVKQFFFNREILGNLLVLGCYTIFMYHLKHTQKKTCNILNSMIVISNSQDFERHVSSCWRHG